MPQLDAGLALQIRHRQVTARAYSGRTVTDLVGPPLFAGLDELLECAGREGRMYEDGIRQLGDERYGHEAPLAVIRDVLVQELVGDGGTGRAEQKSLPVGPGLGDDLRTDVA